MGNNFFPIMRGRRQHNLIGYTLCILAINFSTQSTAGWAPDPAFDFGDASDFSVLSFGKPSDDTLGQSKLDLSRTTVYGDVGVGPWGTLDFQGPATIEGDLYLDPTLQPSDVISDDGTVTGSRFTDIDLTTAVADAKTVAETYRDASPTQTFGTITGNLTVTGAGGTSVNVIEIANLDYSGSSDVTPLELTLSGTTDELFVLNIVSKLDLGPAASITGVDPSKVILNVLSGNTPAQTGSNSWVGGTILALDRKIALQGISGPVMGGLVSEISLVGGALVAPPSIAAVDLEKWTNDLDADTPPGALVQVGDTVTWTYRVKNTGTLPLVISSVVDDQEGTISCSATLSPGERVDCTASATAIAGQYTNTASVTAAYDGGTVNDSDQSNYYGSEGTPECTGDVVEIAARTYTSGEIIHCIGGTSITTLQGETVTVSNGATVLYEAPYVELNYGFSVEDFGQFSVITP